MDHVLKKLRNTFYAFVHECYGINPQESHTFSFTLNTDEQKAAFGDISTNVALIIGAQTNKTPRAIAQELVDTFRHECVLRMQVAGPGFINIFLTHEAFVALATDYYQHRNAFFYDKTHKKGSYSIEFVSANPTGPLHLGNGRNGVIGDVLGNILHLLGHQVTKEYYVNDAGIQIQNLGASLKARVEQEFGMSAEIPENGYHGEYLKDIAHSCIQEYGNDVLHSSHEFFATYAKNAILTMIKNTLEKFGITFDLWFSEKSLHENGNVATVLKQLENHQVTYEHDGALWFKSTNYGDDKDRVLKKANGELTYVAADAAYIKNKFDRVDKAVYVLGQDHHSYVIRLKGIAQALGYNPENLEVILYQLVTLQEKGEQVRMSKRAGTMVTLQEIVDRVGTDVARFFFLNRKADAHLDFDLDLALSKTQDNPVFYIQYAYVRIKSILLKALDNDTFTAIDINDAVALGKEEYGLLKKILSLEALLNTIAYNFQTHLLAYYVIELAQQFHHYYTHHKVLDADNVAASRSRLFLLMLLQSTFELCFDLLGISKPEKM